MDERLIAMSEKVSKRSGLPEMVVLTLFKAGWTYSEHTNGERKWIKPPLGTVVIQEKP
ncbi:hypothetical protein QEH42_gp231 [Microbacterium phage Pumpernickel]|uniref:Uncharacterized protein n=1 Tax=Microbacterium phage Pumpernickel TaxID=2885983 RepID=A0AAE8YA19_9CAUD|nr:hypothetical protein QEH42_gp231 [Microbacterium phage Pumpernickel]UDL15987.1 hypothetical protein SEA_PUMPERNICKEL_237 [Microbacterium phage Pumpernickel]